MFERRLQCLNMEHYQLCLWAGPESNEAQGIISTGAILMHRAIKVPPFLPSMLDRYSASATNTVTAITEYTESIDWSLLDYYY